MTRRLLGKVPFSPLGKGFLTGKIMRAVFENSSALFFVSQSRPTLPSGRLWWPSNPRNTIYRGGKTSYFASTVTFTMRPVNSLAPA